ncbi:MAG: preprotein translocase subunit SecG [Nitrospirota bacterium]|nr:preprotein translocase subunit SecG [Nitrospirota bacterium]
MNALLVTLHVIVCIALIVIVLLQRGKGAEMGAALGGGSSQTLFGSRGATTFLGKLTTTAAIIFMLTSLALAYISTKSVGGGGGSVIDSATLPKPAQSAPAQAPTPAAPPVEQPKELPAPAQGN